MTAQTFQEIVLLENVRVSYLYAFRPYIGKNSEGKETKTYCVHALMQRDDANHMKMKAAVRKVAAAWGTNSEAVLQQLAATDKLCVHDGNITRMGKDEYRDKIYVAANSSNRPSIVVSRGGLNVPIEADDAYAPYSGCWCNIFVAVYPQNPPGKPNRFGNRINAQLTGVQFLRHDEAFGGAGRMARPEEFPVQDTGSADAAAPSAQSGAAGLI